ncbi:MAG: calcium-binding EGF-like domain-containing protein [Bradymonadaceae bacterium]
MSLNCGSHGSCDDSSGSAECSCDTGYRGSNCASCASGYQDNDGDGSCEKSCATASVNCGNHGQCVDSSGAALCSCDQGYTGPTCGKCIATYQDNDGDGTCKPSCQAANLDCNNHGTCDASSGTPSCSCDKAYTGTKCGSCASGYQDDDGDGSCKPTCATAGLDCNNDGNCGTSSGAPSCNCDPAYTGSRCGSCASGYQDADGNDTCEPTCATANLSCGAHANCAISGGSPSCTCTTGYTDVGGACKWRGGPDDPGFQKQPGSSPWSVQNGAELKPGASGKSNPGEAQIPAKAACRRGRVVQSFPMPSYSSAEPLALKFQTRIRNCQSISCQQLKVYIGIDGGWTKIRRVPSRWQEHSVCLGAGSYGGSKKLTVRSSSERLSPRVCGQTKPRLAFDNVRVVPASSSNCPAPGAIPNGDFSSGDKHWNIDKGANWSQASVVASAGKSRSKGALLQVSRCGNAEFSRPLSIPAATGSKAPALVFDAAINSNSHPSVSLGVLEKELEGNGQFRRHRICLPDWVRGTSKQLKFTLAEGGVCGNDNFLARFDNVSISQMQGCSSGKTALLFGGFEDVRKSSVDSPWTVNKDDEHSGRIVDDPNQARSGRGVLKLETNQPCSSSRGSTVATLPEPKGSKGPAAVFWYRTADFKGGQHGATFRPVARNQQSNKARFDADLSQSSRWTKATKCLPPGQAGIPRALRFELTGGGGLCQKTISPGKVWVDDVKLTRKSACPTQ